MPPPRLPRSVSTRAGKRLKNWYLQCDYLFSTFSNMSISIIVQNTKWTVLTLIMNIDTVKRQKK